MSASDDDDLLLRLKAKQHKMMAAHKQALLRAETAEQNFALVLAELKRMRARLAMIMEAVEDFLDESDFSSDSCSDSSSGRSPSASPKKTRMGQGQGHAQAQGKAQAQAQAQHFIVVEPSAGSEFIKRETLSRGSFFEPFDVEELGGELHEM